MSEAIAKTRAKRVKPAPPMPGLEPLDSLSKDLRLAARTLGDREARFLVDAYYDAQDKRIRDAHQVRSLAKAGEPNEVLEWFLGLDTKIEGQIKTVLDDYSVSRTEGVWARSIMGIGPVIVAGLMANIDIERAPTVGHIWRFAGLDPSMKWEKKTKRPWNASLKRLCFIMGESFTKFQNSDRDVYGKVYRARRVYEVRRNDAGLLSEQARISLVEKNFAKDTEALAWYSGCFPAGTCQAWNDLELESRQIWPDDSANRSKWLTHARQTYLLSVRVPAGEGLPMLPPARILLRSQRVATKLFLSHYHHVLHEVRFGRPPRHPYILDANTHIAHPELAVHMEFLAPPNWPMEAGTGLGESAVVEE